MMTTGTLTTSESAQADEVRGSYKLYEIEPLCGGGAVGFSAFFRGLSNSHLRLEPWTVPANGAPGAEATRRPRGETVQSGRNKG